MRAKQKEAPVGRRGHWTRAWWCCGLVSRPRRGGGGSDVVFFWYDWFACLPPHRSTLRAFPGGAVDHPLRASRAAPGDACGTSVGKGGMIVSVRGVRFSLQWGPRVGGVVRKRGVRGASGRCLAVVVWFDGHRGRATEQKNRATAWGSPGQQVRGLVDHPDERCQTQLCCCLLTPGGGDGGRWRW